MLQNKVTNTKNNKVRNNIQYLIQVDMIVWVGIEYWSLSKSQLRQHKQK